ncbi:hypothetical protein [Cognatishimia sp. F0-27]|uniref:hypothetical protein n=1 Tax=Cognatishimia sp. F0-27 TaxID=2816855 RepID=UPI001D0C2D9A|nr:hypothetical protein [Cognatishimia sp. F0-27]MCC1493025.1 hypothetical protein [Cognatishimia sp. F0-27]
MMRLLRRAALCASLGLTAACSEEIATGAEGARAGLPNILALATQPQRDDEPGVLGGLSSPREGATLRSAMLVRGAVGIDAPRGYCIDRTTLKTGAEAGFAVLGSCHILSGETGQGRVRPALITVAVGDRATMDDLPTPEQLASASGASLVSGARQSGMVMANLSDDTIRVLARPDPRYWRATLLVNDRLVALALYVPEGSPLAGRGGAQLLGQVRDGILAGSPKQQVSGLGIFRAGPAKPAVGDAAGEKQRGFLGRLLNP